MAKKNTNAQVLARMTLSNGAVVDIYDIDLARQMGLIPGSADVGNAPAQENTTSAKQKKSCKGKGKPASELVEFVNSKGEKKMVSSAQAATWEEWRSGSSERKEQFEQMKKDWTSKREGYKPSKALEDAIKADRCAVTHKVAKETYGFVGTKEDLKALKARICK